MKKFFPYIFSASLLALLLSGACRDEDFLPDNPPKISDDAIRVGAKIDQEVSTRAYIEKGDVKTGNFILTYPYYIAWIDQVYGVYRYLYHYGDVTFGYQGEETTGFVNVGTGANPKELVWSPTNTGTSTDDGIIRYPAAKPSPVYLDNFMCKALFTASNTTTSNAGTTNAVDSIVDIAKSYPQNPYKAGIFDEKNGSNDLLWGSLQVPEKTELIHFNLSHRMTRLRLKVIVETNNADQPNEEMSICLNNASVTLTNVLLDPVTYMRQYGELLFQSRKSASEVSSVIDVERQNFRMVRSPKAEDYDIPDDNGYYYKWASKTVNEETGDATFTSQDFVFVPQILPQGNTDRPTIRIAVPYDDVNKGINPGYDKEYNDSIYFSAIIPVTMYKYNGEGIPPSLQTLNFDAGNVITLTTKMKPGEMQLEFAPVTVEPWVYKGTFIPSAKQSGIYSAEDLYNLIKFYKDNNEYWLHRYGYVQTNGKWMFMVNSGGIEFDIEQIVGKMIPGTDVEVDGQPTQTPDFEFDFRNRDEYYIMPDGTKVTMGSLSSNLRDIVTTPANTGVKPTASDPAVNNFSELIEAYQKNFWQQLVFGTYDKENALWTFNVSEDVTLDYTQIAAQMLPRKTGEQVFQFNIPSGVSVTVANYPSPGQQKVVDAEELYKIVSERIPGLYSTEDFTNLFTVIKSGQIGAIAQYGTYDDSTSTWTFPLQRNVTLKSVNVQGELYGVEDIQYQIVYTPYELSLYQYDDTTVKNPDFSALATLLSLQKPAGLNVADDFTSLIEAYNSDSHSLEEISEFGYYCLSTPRWVFFFNAGMTLDRQEIAGSMVPDATEGKLPFKFNLNHKQIKFKDEPGDGISGNNGAETLLEIVSTPKPEPEPEPDPTPTPDQP